MKVQEYAEKYGRSISGVYHLIYEGKIPCWKQGGVWEVEDAPPPPFNAKSTSFSLAQFDDYDISLLWLNATIIDRDNLIIRSKDGYVPRYLAKKYGLNVQNTARNTLKISSKSLCNDLREMGFTGRKDNDLAPST